MKVIVTAKNAGGEGSASARTAVVVPAPPSSKGRPEISGTAMDGETLVVSSTGTWGGTPPFTFSYQWQRCNSSGEGCNNIEGATSSSYSLGHSDVGTTVQVIVTAKNGGGEATGVSKRTAVVAPLAPSVVETKGPTISGEARDEKTLTAENGTWKGTPTITFTYQWQICNSLGEACNNISGATSSTYKLTPTEVGSTLKVIVTAENAAGKASATSEKTAVVVAAPPVDEKLSKIKGTAEDGETLTAEIGTWKGTPTITYAYQWELCNKSGEACNNISGATSSTYELKPTEVGDTLRVIVTAENAVGKASATSEQTPVVTLRTLSNVVLPSIKGTAKDGETLTASEGTWKGTPTITYAYQWELCNKSGEACNNISGATSSTYKLKPTEVGDTMRVIVTAENPGGKLAVPSEKTAVVVAAPPVNEKTLPSIKGTARDGETLTAETGTWKGTPTITYAYQWQSCNSLGEACFYIPGATASTYKLSPTEVGLTLRVTVTAKNGGGEAPATSEKTALVVAAPPVNEKLPAISGEARDEKTLTAETGTWKGTPTITYAYQWELCNKSGEACNNISGATSSTYKLTPTEVGDTLRVIVTAENAGGKVPATSEKTAVVAAAPPVNEKLPTIKGTAEDGETLTAEIGTWKGTPTITYAYQWELCNKSGEACNNISGATSSTYKLTPTEVGDTLRVIVTAENAGGKVPATSEKTAVVVAAPPVNEKALPSIKGTVRDGETLTAETGTWKGTPTITFTEQWQSCNGSGEACKNISGATGSTYKLTPGEVGDTLRVTVTAKNGGGEASATSEKTAVVAPLAPSVEGKGPSISGTARDGETLTAETGTWKGTPTITYSYQWETCNGSGEACTNISGATSSTYKLKPTEVGDTMRVIVTAENAGGKVPATSEKSALVVAAPPVNEKLPAISGEARDEKTLTAETGTWKGTPTITYAYQWQTCKGEACNNISGATSSTYKLTPTEVGDTMRVIVTAENAGGKVPATSEKTAVVVAAPPVNEKTLPSIKGTARDGETLTAETGTWKGTPTITYSYQWETCNGSGEACTNISGATSSTYKLTPAEVGDTLRVIVTAKNGGGEAPATSEKTAVVVAAPPVNEKLPKINGTAEDGETLTAETGTWKGTPTITYAYQWELCNKSGEACNNISGATSSTYKLTPTEVGDTLRVIVTAENAGGKVPATSEKTAVVAAAPPVNEKLPTIKGTAEDGETLTAEIGTWKGTPTITYAYQWELCNKSGEACNNISGATSSTYKLTPTEVGDTLRVIVTAENAGGKVPATSEKTALVVGAPPVLEKPLPTTLPTIKGTARDGQLLTATEGTWKGTPTITYAYQWESCNSLGEACFYISGATTSSYRLISSEVGTTLRVMVTAKNAGGEISAISSPTEVVEPKAPENTEKPKISGEAKDGQTLSASTGSWKGTPTIAYSYQWQRCPSLGECKNIEGATSLTYALGHGDVGSKLQIIVTAKNAGGEATSVSEQQTAVVAALAPGNEVLPSIKGTAEDGETLTAETGAWKGTPTITYAYQWETCNTSGESCNNISGATSSTYKLKPTEVGDTLRVIVTAENAGGKVPATSEKSALVVAAPPVNEKTPPSIKGTAKEGETLTAETGTWKGTPTITYSYQWQSCNSSGEACFYIAGATSSTHKLTSGEVGSTLRVTVTAKNGGGEASATSPATGVVPSTALENIEKPQISGTAEDEHTLTASEGTWKGTPTITYTYQWELCNKSGEACNNISGATSSTYKLTPTEVGDTLRVIVTAENPAGQASATSAATPVVVAAPPTVVESKGPTISGEAEDEHTLTASEGSWKGTPTITYTYQWETCNSSGTGCNNISGATSSTYKLKPTEVGDTMRVVVTAENAGGKASATSEKTPVVVAAPPTVVESKGPTISGEAEDEHTLTAETGSWKGTPTITYAYQWETCNSSGTGCTNISGATSSTYKLKPTEVGDTMRVVVTAENAGGKASATSEKTAVVVAAPPTVVEGKGPRISGEAEDEHTLTAETGSWKGTPTITYTYQWETCNSSGTGCTNISGATSSTYKLKPTEVGDTMRVVVTAENAGGKASSTSVATPVVVAAPPVNEVLPSAKGTAEDEHTLTAETGTWKGTPTITYAYQWELCNKSGEACNNISGATSSTYKLKPTEVGSTLKVIVTAENAAGKASATSVATPVVVAAPPVNEVLPTIEGTDEESQILTASEGTWRGTPTITYTYQWELCNKSGEACNNISGATSSTHKLGSGEVGGTIRVVVTAKNGGGEAPVTSEKTLVVTASPTFGKTTVGASSETFAANRKRVNRYALPTAGSVTKLSIYLAPTTTSGSQVMEGIVYSDSSGTPSTLLGTSQPLTFTSTSETGWYELKFATPLNLAAGNYWIGVITGANSGVAGYRYDSVSGSRDYNTNTYTSGPTSTFGTVTPDSEQMSLYATYVPPVSATAPPKNVKPPSIKGTAEEGQTLTAENGTWSESPTSFTYQWEICNSSGEACNNIPGATNPTYTLTQSEVGSTMRVVVTAKNGVGEGTATSEKTAVVVVTPLTPPSVLEGKGPSIKGTAEEGLTLTAETGTWKGTPTITYTYQWEICNSSGEACKNISGATSATYKLSSGEVGSTVRVIVTAENAVGKESATSPASAVVTKGSNIFGSLTPLSPAFIEMPTEPIAIVVSPDGKFAYVGYEYHESISEFSRNTETGALTALSPATVATGADPRAITISPDGKSLYVTNFAVGTVSQFSRNTETGKLTPLSPATVPSGEGGHGIAVSPDGKSVYVTNYQSKSDSVSQYSRNTETGALTPLSPASVAAGENPDGVVISGDGKSVYVNNRFGDSVSQYSRNAETGKLTPLSPATVPAGVEVHGIAISPDNKTVYAANAQSEDVSQYSRNAETGALTPLSPATVKTGDEPFEIAVSPDNESVYVTNDDENGLSEPSISQFNRNTETGALSALSPASVETGTHPYGITISPDGRFIYVANKETPEVAGRIYAYARTTGGSGTFGKTTVGASSDEFAANRKRVNRYALPTAGSVTKLSIYLAPTTTSGSQVMEGIVYSDSSGTPSTLLGTTKPLTFTSTSAAGWYELSFATPLNLAVGNYWIGVITGATGDVAGYRYESVSGSRDYNTNTYTSGPTTTFGTVTPDSQQMSLYATYTIG